MVCLWSLLLLFQFDETKLQRQYHYKHWQHGEQGFIADTITSIGQDSLGFIWVGTASSLQRFDGHRFESLPQLADPVTGISSNQIRTIHTDKRGFLWVGTFDKGLNRLDPRSLEVLRISFDQGDDTKKGMNRISAVAEDRKGSLWVSTISGLNRLNLDTLEIKSYFFESSSATNSDANLLTNVFVDAKDTVWVSSYAGLFKYHPESDRFTPVVLQRAPGQEQKRLNVSQIVEDEMGALLLGTFGDGILRLNQDLSASHLADWQGENVFHLIKDQQGRFWRGYFNEGLKSYDPKTKTHRSLLDSPEDPQNLSKKSVTTLFEDGSGNLWIGTQESGLYCFRSKTSAFNHLTLASQYDKRATRNVTSVAPSRKGKFWVGSEAGQVFSVHEGSLQKQLLLREGERGPVEVMMEDRQGFLWVGYRFKGMLRIDPSTGKQDAFGNVRGDATSLSSNAVRDIVEDVGGQIWIATTDGLNQFLPEQQVFRRYRKGTPLGQGLESDVILALLADQQGQIWLANSQSQIHVMDPKKNQFKRILISDQVGLDKYDFQVNALAEGSEGMIYASVSGDGIKRIDPQTHTSSPINGSPKFAAALVEDEEGFLWVSSVDSGLYRLDPKTDRLIHYRVEHGIQSLNYSAHAGTRLANGELLFGGVNGLNLFSPQAVAIDSVAPTLFFQDVLASGQPLADFSMTHALDAQEQKTLNLPHWQNALTIKFLGLNVANAEANRFEHRLEPQDQAWIPMAPAQREISFYNLGPGRYQFALRAKNGDGVWTEAPRYLNFVINPPWWKTRQAMVFYLVAGLFAIWLWIWWRTTSLRKRAIKLEAQVEARTQEIKAQKDTIENLLDKQKILFANISHEFRTPLTLILGPIERLIKSSKPQSSLKMIRRNAQKLLRMVDQILDLTRLANRDLVPMSSTLASQALEPLLDAFHGILEERDLKLEQKIDPNCWIDMHPDSFEKIVLNLLSNAIKYSDEGDTIRVTLTSQDDRICFCVEDTGLGIPSEDLEHIFSRFYRSGTHQRQRIPGAGIGLALVKELTELSGGTIDVESQDGAGTTFTLLFPPGSKDSSPALKSAMLLADSPVEMELSTLKEDPSLEPITDQAKTSRTASVLIIEDHQGMRDYIQSELAGSYQCHTAANGVEGLEAAKRLIPDLILSDVMMPGMDGFEMTHALKTEATTSHIPVILITARGDQESKTEGIREGADAYLTKPFDSQELRYRIENMLGLREILRKRFVAEFHNQDTQTSENFSPQNPLDKAFLEKFNQVLAENYQETSFGLKEMVEAMAMSERPLQRKLKALTDHTPAQFLRNYRLKRAADLLREGYRSSEVAFEIGFASHAYFSSCFKALFSMSPSVYAKKNLGKRVD